MPPPPLKGYLRGADNRRDYPEFSATERALLQDIGMVWAKVPPAEDVTSELQSLEARIASPYGLTICAGSKLWGWRHQNVTRIAAGTCFATRIEDQPRIVTASHCYEGAQVGGILRLVFGHHTGTAGLSYLSAQFVNQLNDDDEDWAVLRPLSPHETPSPTTATPAYAITLAGSHESVHNNAAVFTIGFPHGLPAKVTSGKITFQQQTSYRTNLDVFGGNSGGPLFAKVGGVVKAVGIMRQATSTNWHIADGCIQEPTDCPVPGSPACSSRATKVTQLR
jgi:hypothetical protein